MADIRIKDLTTLESASLTGDVFVIDGTTGTRKLSAFSPTFGGNATVTGTLTVNGTTASVGAGTGSIISKLNGAAGSYKLSIYQSAGVDRWYAGLAAGAESGSDGGAPYSIVALTDAGAVIDNALLITRAAGGSITTPRPVSISATTASTSTSSGALVVGNGTSGGLGVGGNAYIGGDLVVASHTKGIYSQGYVAVKGYQANLFSRGAPAGWTAGLHFYTNGNDYSATILHYPDNGDLQFFINATSSNYAASDEALRITTAKQVQVKASTASTSTSSGALVVSGGVGVAGAINAGGTITSTNGSGSGLLGMRSSSGNASYVFWSETGVADRGILGFNNGSSTLSYRSFSSSFSTGTEVFSVTSAGNITTGGNITTAAPAGGTAAAWKLGTVATVSPTSPNRTIEVDIGGTIYYIHAKTTNN